MKTTLFTLSAIAAGIILTGCGSSDTTDTTSATIPTTNLISGTVPGTLIEAFCDDGSYYSVKSTQNDTTAHPFEIEIPNTVNCRLVMTTNEDDFANKVVTPIGIITADGNGTLFRAAANVDLGHIDLAMSRDDINDSTGDGVSDDILSIRVDNALILVELENDPMDDDHDGLLNVYEDDDHDGLSNYDDDDDDNDGLDDSVDYDDDNDGIADNDLDGDGISNDDDVDDDNDEIHDDYDSDDDNDGIDDDHDSDDDNDGIDDDYDDDYNDSYDDSDDDSDDDDSDYNDLNS